MRIKGLAIAALAASLTATAVAPAAAEGDLYNWVGASIGNTDFNYNNLSGITPGSIDNSGNGWKIYLGFPITKSIGLEVGYMDLGEASITGATGNTSNTRAKVYNFDLVGNYDFNESFSLLGKAGIYRWGMHSDTVIGGKGSTADDDGFDFHYGLGLQYNPNREIGLRLEWERFNNMGFKGTTGETDADLFSLGAVYKFKFF
jgi:OmpA-OmpF porin, OOP family